MRNWFNIKTGKRSCNRLLAKKKESVLRTETQETQTHTHNTDRDTAVQSPNTADKHSSAEWVLQMTSKLLMHLHIPHICLLCRFYFFLLYFHSAAFAKTQRSLWTWWVKRLVKVDESHSSHHWSSPARSECLWLIWYSVVALNRQKWSRIQDSFYGHSMQLAHSKKLLAVYDVRALWSHTCELCRFE